MAGVMAKTCGAQTLSAFGARPRTQARKSLRAQAEATGSPLNRVSQGKERPLWYPGNDPAPGLDDSLPGYYGFDPLGFIQDEESKRWYQQAELVHCRICMTSAAGILFPAIANASGAANIPPWYSAGKVWIDTHPAFPFPSMLFVQFLLIGWVESKRWADLKNPGSQGDGSFLGVTDELKGQSNGYPGGKWFDPFGFSRGDEASLASYKEKEVKNGRLAILANLGFAAQYAATNTDPITNLTDHLRDPTHINFATNGVSLPFY
jgi:light-harvesting complex I chlorophyll a/b binding protein 5